MKNKLAVNTKTCTTKAGRRFLALLMVCVMIFSLAACGGQKTGGSEEIKPVTVEREPEPQALQTANEATALALRQYIYARLATEAFLTADASSMTIEELSKMADELLLAWENAEQFSSSAEDITNRAAMLLETPNLKQTSAADELQSGFMTLAAAPINFSVVAYAAESGRKIDPQTWAENLTKQYDALKGAKRYQQLAQQLGTDAKTAYEQMALAQKIIKSAAELEEAEGVVNAYTESINYLQGVKTASKVGVFVVGTVVTGGGSLSALGASSWSLGQTGAVIVGGTDCIVDIAATGSNIILGENHQVTVGFNDVKDKLAPVSAVVGLATFNSGETGEQLAYIGDTLVDWFYEGKVMGVQVDGRSVTARIFDSAGGAALKSALEIAGYVFPETSRTLVQIMDELESDPETALARMDALVSQMAELEQAAGLQKETAPDLDGQENTSPQAPAGNASIFGTYTCVTTYKSDDNTETETETITLRDNGNGTLVWISEDGDKTYLSYEQDTNTIHTESEGLTVHVEFSLSGNTVTGDGYISGTFWDEPVKATLSLTKISD
ncbi:MAG: hypothetical protein HPY74_15610 [Firmicutes bacterium]|nr:hypothetical protein [Bacillota bacterium]